MIKLSEDIKIISGYNRSMLYDFTKNEYHFIPNFLAKFIKEKDGKLSLIQLKKLLKNDINLEYYNFFKEKKYIVDIPLQFIKNFVPLPLSYESPHLLHNIKFHISKKNIDSLRSLILQVDFSNYTNNISLIIDSGLDIDIILNLIENFKSKSLLGLFIVLPNELSELGTSELLKQYGDVHIENYDYISGELYNSKEYLSHFPQIVKGIKDFSEAHYHNIYTYKKLFIDCAGNIKNTPEQESNYGNIKDISFFEDIIVITQQKKFQYDWNIPKDEVEICKDCELRYCCLDNRPIYIKNEKGGYCKIDCKYNPYICLWENEEGYLPAKECGNSDEKENFMKNHSKIRKLNLQIWRE